MNKPLHFIILFLALFWCHGSISAAEESNEIFPDKKEYFLGVFPYLPVAQLEGVFAPIAAEIGRATGKRIHFRSAPDFNSFMTRLERQDFDIAFIQPFDYVKIAAKVGYIPLAKRREPISAIFVVKEQSSLGTLHDLKGKKISMASEYAAISYIGKAILIDNGLLPGTDVSIDHMKGHHSCLQDVLIGHSSACVTGKPALRLFEDKMGIKMKILHETENSFPGTLFVVHQTVPKHDRIVIEKTILQTRLKEVDPVLRTLLMQNNNPPFETASDEDYNSIRQFWLQIQKANE